MRPSVRSVRKVGATVNEHQATSTNPTGAGHENKLSHNAALLPISVSCGRSVGSTFIPVPLGLKVLPSRRAEPVPTGGDLLPRERVFVTL